METTTEDDRKTSRAPALPLEERQSMIIDAVIPLILENGRNVTTKQIAEAAGIAEGTIFRAFDDKESLINAAIARHLDPGALREALGAIDARLPLEDKVRTMLVLLQNRFAGIFRLMAALEQTERPGPSEHHKHTQHGYARIVAEVLAPDAHRLGIPAERVGPVIRLIAFASSLPIFNEHTPFTVDELTELILHGIAGAPASAAHQGKTSPCSCE